MVGGAQWWGWLWSAWRRGALTVFTAPQLWAEVPVLFPNNALAPLFIGFAYHFPSIFLHPCHQVQPQLINCPTTLSPLYIIHHPDTVNVSKIFFSPLLETDTFAAGMFPAISPRNAPKTCASRASVPRPQEVPARGLWHPPGKPLPRQPDQLPISEHSTSAFHHVGVAFAVRFVLKNNVMFSPGSTWCPHMSSVVGPFGPESGFLQQCWFKKLFYLQSVVWAPFQLCAWVVSNYPSDKKAKKTLFQTQMVSVVGVVAVLGVSSSVGQGCQNTSASCTVLKLE